MNALVIIGSVVGGLLALLVFIHLVVFMIWLMMLPWLIIISFIDAFAGAAPRDPVLYCPFMKWWRFRD